MISVISFGFTEQSFPPRFHNINIETIRKEGREEEDPPFSTLFKPSCATTFAEVSRWSLSSGISRSFQGIPLMGRHYHCKNLTRIFLLAIPFFLFFSPLLFTVIAVNHGYMKWKCHGNRKKVLNEHYVWINIIKKEID